MTPLRFSLHARRQMGRRHITENEVIEALAQPETSYASREHPDRQVLLGSTDAGRRLKVVVVSDDNLVVTVADRDQP